MAVVPIIYNNATINARFSAAINGAFKELFAASGIRPVVYAGWETSDGIPGGSRTLLEAIRAGSGPRSNHYENNPYAAVDINNQRQFRNWDEGRFLAILAKWGFHNVQINGAPFPSEPWHFANQSDNPISQAGEIGEPIGDDMSAEDVATLKDAERRESRARIYKCTEHKDEWVTINWNLASNDPGKIGYPKNAAQVKNLAANYQYVGDTDGNAKKLNHEGIKTAIRLARGTDQLFEPTPNFK